MTGENTTLKETARKATEATAAVGGATREMSASTERMKDAADRRTELAANRTVLAAERTYAAWIRTGLAALASGVGARKLLEDVVPEWMIVSTGTLLVLFSAFCFVVAVWREIFPNVREPEPEVRRLPSLLLVAANGFLTLVAIAALVGIWFGRAIG